MLYDFYHGVANKHPSQIKLLCEGASFHKDLCDLKSQRIVANKNKGKSTTKSTRKSLALKSLLSREEFMTFTAGEEINERDLKTDESR